MLELPPHHLVDNAHVRLDDANHLSAYILIHIVRDGDSGKAVADEGDGNVYALEEALGVDATEHEATFVKSLGALGGGADTYSRERMTDTGKEAALFW